MSAASDELAERLETLIGHRPGVTARRMFGGTCFMLHGNMVCCAMKPGTLLLRVGADGYDAALASSGVQPMLMGEREMTGFVEVTDDIEDDADLMAWVGRGWDFASTLPPKADAPPRSRKTPAKR